MSAERKALRADLLAAITAAAADHPPLADAQIISAWATDISPDALPVIGVTVPLETVSPASHDADLIEHQAVVVVKLIGAGGDTTDLEDALDDAAQALAGPVEAALMTARRDAALKSSAIKLSDAGSPRIGTLTLTFETQTSRGRTRP